MKLEFITNACVMLHLAGDRTLLVDPWIGGSAFYGSWYNFPPLLPEAIERYRAIAPDFIYISHIHPDHLHAPSLAHYPRSTPVLIGKLPHDHLRRAIAAIGFQDIRELELGGPVGFDDLELTILPDFGSSGDGYADDTGYAMDSSLHVRDRDGSTLLHVVDNCIQPEDAAALRDRYGTLDIAVLPYGGASFFPHAFFAYDEATKAEMRDSVKKDRLDLFVEIARILQPRYCVPAAGSYVMGSRIAHYSRYLHQATPDEIEDAVRTAPLATTELRQLCTGDRLDSHSGEVEQSPDAPFRRYSSEERCEYAERELAGLPLAQDAVAVPPEFSLPWQRMLTKARANQRAMQAKLGVFPPVDIELTISPGANVSLAGHDRLVFGFALDEGTAEGGEALRTEADRADAHRRAPRMRVRFRLEASLLYMLLTGAAIWNNAEIGALIECAREPDVHDPTVHSLMSFFAL